MDSKKKKLKYCMQTLLLPENFKDAINLQSIKIRTRNPLSVTLFTDLIEPHTKLYADLQAISKKK